jgi:hypothetical protein
MYKEDRQEMALGRMFFSHIMLYLITIQHLTLLYTYAIEDSYFQTCQLGTETWC